MAGASRLGGRRMLASVRRNGRRWARISLAFAGLGLPAGDIVRIVSTRPLRVLTANGVVHMAIQPLDDRIVVKPNESEETTASGLVIPDTAKEKPQQGEVLAAGPGRRSEQTGERIPPAAKVGDTVVYSNYGAT